MNKLYDLRKKGTDDYLSFRCDESSNVVIWAGNKTEVIAVKMDSVMFDETCGILDMHETALYSPETSGRSKITFKKDFHELEILLQNEKDKVEIEFELTMNHFRNIVKRVHRGLIANEAAELVKSYMAENERRRYNANN